MEEKMEELKVKVEVELLRSHVLPCLQKKYNDVLAEQDDLRISIQERQDLTQQYQQRSEKLQLSLQDNQEHFRLKLEAEKVWTSNHLHHRSSTSFDLKTSLLCFSAGEGEVTPAGGGRADAAGEGGSGHPGGGGLLPQATEGKG